MENQLTPDEKLDALKRILNEINALKQKQKYRGICKIIQILGINWEISKMLHEHRATINLVYTWKYWFHEGNSVSDFNMRYCRMPNGLRLHLWYKPRIKFIKSLIKEIEHEL